MAVIDTATHKVLRTITFDLPEVPRTAIQAVGINLTRDGRYAFIDLGPANRVAVVDPATFEVKKYLLVGQRVWHGDFSPDQRFLYTANGISNDMSVIDVDRLDAVRTGRPITLGRGRCTLNALCRAPASATVSGRARCCTMCRSTYAPASAACCWA